jgi:hypothetical protein
MKQETDPRNNPSNNAKNTGNSQQRKNADSIGNDNEETVEPGLQRNRLERARKGKERVDSEEEFEEEEETEERSRPCKGMFIGVYEGDDPKPRRIINVEGDKTIASKEGIEEFKANINSRVHYLIVNGVFEYKIEVPPGLSEEQIKVVRGLVKEYFRMQFGAKQVKLLTVIQPYKDMVIGIYEGGDPEPRYIINLEANEFVNPRDEIEKFKEKINSKLRYLNENGVFEYKIEMPSTLSEEQINIARKYVEKHINIHFKAPQIKFVPYKQTSSTALISNSFVSGARLIGSSAYNNLLAIEKSLKNASAGTNGISKAHSGKLALGETTNLSETIGPAIWSMFLVYRLHTNLNSIDRVSEDKRGAWYNVVRKTALSGMTILNAIPLFTAAFGSPIVPIISVGCALLGTILTYGIAYVYWDQIIEGRTKPEVGYFEKNVINSFESWVVNLASSREENSVVRTP